MRWSCIIIWIFLLLGQFPYLSKSLHCFRPSRKPWNSCKATWTSYSTSSSKRTSESKRKHFISQQIIGNKWIYLSFFSSLIHVHISRMKGLWQTVSWIPSCNRSAIIKIMFKKVLPALLWSFEPLLQSLFHILKYPRCFKKRFHWKTLKIQSCNLRHWFSSAGSVLNVSQNTR